MWSREMRARRAMPAMMVTLALALALSACAEKATTVEWPMESPVPSSRPANPTPTMNPAEAEATQEILAVVDGYRRAELSMFTDPQMPHSARPVLSEYLADPLLSQTLSTLNDMHRDGIAFEGQFSWEAEVAELRLDDTPPVATVRDCVDSSNWRSVFIASRNQVPGSDRPEVYVSLLQVMLYPEGWLIYEAGVKDGEAC